MSSPQLHVVFGAGQVGRVLSARLAAAELDVRVVSRRRPSTLAEGVRWRGADVSDAEAAGEAASGAAVIYQCLNAPYNKWPKLFPPLQRGVLSAAEQTGALLVSLENVYAYGPTMGRPMTEQLGLAAKTVKGRIRAAMTEELLAAAKAGRVRIAVGRAADFFGAEVTETILGDRVFGNAVKGKRADFIGDPDLPHTYSYVPDVAAGLATLGNDERAIGGIWHLPVAETVTTRQMLDLVATAVGHPVGIRTVPKVMLHALGLFDPMIRELGEIGYQVDEPFILDTHKYRDVFGDETTPLARAVEETISWYRTLVQRTGKRGTA